MSAFERADFIRSDSIIAAKSLQGNEVEVTTERETMDFDVVIVGGGPSGLSAAIRLMQLAAESGQELMVCLVEKGSEIGAHILSGAVFYPRALDELIPDWSELGAPVNNLVTKDEYHCLLSESRSVPIPKLFIPKPILNDGNHAISLGNLCRWLGEQAEALGVMLFPGFAATEVLFDDNDRVCGVATGDMGVDKDGENKDIFQPGYELRAKYTLFAEGCRGHLGKQLIRKFGLDNESTTQHYAIGLKELWNVPADQHEQGKVVHALGWPLGLHGSATGGSFLYHLENNQISLGLIVDLSYSNPYLSPFNEFQRWKHHPLISKQLADGTRASYGARAIVKGGLQALPKLTFPGGALVGDDAGFLNVLKVKGSHTAMKSGMLAAEATFENLSNGDGGNEIDFYDRFKQSWLFEELDGSKNAGPAWHKWGLIGGSAYSFIEQNLAGGRSLLKLSDPKPDHAALSLASKVKPIEYPKPDDKLSFDRLSSVFLSNTNHEEDQPCHLQLSDDRIPIDYNLPKYAEPAQLYCPAGVYEVVEEAGSPRFQINAQNCVHCKTCDIKDPSQNINWVAPEGGGGPNYPNM